DEFSVGVDYQPRQVVARQRDNGYLRQRAGVSVDRIGRDRMLQHRAGVYLTAREKQVAALRLDCAQRRTGVGEDPSGRNGRQRPGRGVDREPARPVAAAAEEIHAVVSERGARVDESADADWRPSPSGGRHWKLAGTWQKREIPGR